MTGHDAFLASLAAQIRPVAERGLRKRFALWAGCVIGLVIILGFALTRPNLAERFIEPDFLLQFVLWLSVLIVAGGCAFVLATPRWPMARGVKFSMIGLFTGLAAFAVWLAYRFNAPETTIGHESVDLACICIVSGIGILASTFMTHILRHHAKPTYLRLMTFFMSVAGASAGMMAVMVTCGHEAPGHVFVSHFLPAVAFGCVITLVARRWWHW